MKQEHLNELRINLFLSYVTSGMILITYITLFAFELRAGTFLSKTTYFSSQGILCLTILSLWIATARRIIKSEKELEAGKQKQEVDEIIESVKKQNDY